MVRLRGGEGGFFRALLVFEVIYVADWAVDAVGQRAEKRTRVARGRYQPGMRRENNTKVVTSVVDVVEHEEDLYVRSTNGTLIPQRWLVIYEWFAGKKPPKDLVDQISRSAQAWEEYSNW